MNLDYAERINRSVKNAVKNKSFSVQDGQEAHEWENNGRKIITFGICTYELRVDEEYGNVYDELTDITIKCIKDNYNDVESCFFSCEEKGHWEYSLRMKISDKDKKVKLTKSQTKDAKLAKAKKELMDFNTKVLTKIQTQAAPLKTCSHCNSKIAIGFIKKIECNICKKPFYSNTELKRIESINSKIKKAKSA